MKYRLGFDVIDLHQRFKLIHPFQDGNGRVGRLVMFKECLANGIVPFIITGGTPQQYEKKLNIARTERVIIQRGRDESFVPVAQNNVSDKVCKIYGKR